MKRVKRFAAIAVASALTLGMLAGCGGSSDTTNSTGSAEASSADKVIRIGYVDSGNSFPNDVLAVAIDQGYLDEELAAVGYTVETIPFTGAGPAINEAMVNGSIDAATVGDVPAVLGHSNGVENTLISGELNFNDAGLAVPAGSDIKSAADLKGKTVATLEGSYMQKILVDMLEDVGLTTADINFTNMTSADAASAVEAGSVDAAVVGNPQEATLQAAEDADVILTCAEHEEWKGSHAQVIRTEYLEENHDAAVAFVKALIRADEYAVENYDSSIESLAKSGTSPENYKYIFPESVDFQLGGGDDAINTFTELETFLIDNGFVTNEFDVSDWYDSSIYEEAVAALEGE